MYILSPANYIIEEEVEEEAEEAYVLGIMMKNLVAFPPRGGRRNV